MKAKPVYQEQVKRHFEYRDGALYWLHDAGFKPLKGTRAGSDKQKDGRRRINMEESNYLCARLVWSYFNGDLGPDDIIDHINRDHTDDRIENLRKVTKAQNNAFRPARKDNRAGYKGIYRHATKWVAEINCPQRSWRFDEKADAAQMYNFVTLKRYGSGAYMNESGEFEIFEENL